MLMKKIATTYLPSEHDALLVAPMSKRCRSVSGV